MRKVNQRNIIPVLPILTQRGILPLMLEGGDIGCRYPMRVYAFDGATVLGIANNPAQVINLVNANEDNQDIGEVKQYKKTPYAFTITKNPLFVGALPTSIKVEIVYNG